MHTASIEPLESRIAPATLSPSGRSVTYIDGDGDNVTVTISKGAFLLTDFTFGPSATGIAGREQLEALDISGVALLDGASLSITAVPSATSGGDGTVSVGYIDATGIDLGTVVVRGDLGAIDAGDARLSDGGIKSLSVFSLGGEGTLTGAPDLVSNIVGSVGTLRVVSDIVSAQVSITGINAGLGSLIVGGSIVGGSAEDSGAVSAAGTISVVKIGGDLFGGSGARSGNVVGGKLGTVSLGGSIYGGAGADSGQVFAVDTISTVSVGGDLSGGDGAGSGLISADAITSLTLGGTIAGGFGDASGRIEVGGHLAKLRLGGSLIGGSPLSVGLNQSGTIFVGGKLTSAVIGGDVRGGSSATGLDTIETGYLQADSIGAMTIGGSLIGGSDNGGTLIDSGTVRALGAIGSLTIKGDISGGDSSGASGATNGSGYVEAKRLLAMTVHGSVFAGADASLLSNSGAIRAGSDIGTLLVRGSLEGSAEHPVVISALGQPTPTATVDLAMRSITVLGRVWHSAILAGYSTEVSGPGHDVFGTPVNADAQIGTVRVGGDWIASDLIAGLDTGGDGFFGDVDDEKIAIAGVTGGRDTAAISRIASIVIGARVLGESGSGSERNGFGAQFVGSMRVGGTALIPLFAGAGTDLFPSGAYPLGQTLGTFNADGFNVHVYEVT
jgi:hypothetical protein